MKILSLFDGISIAQQALKNLGVKVDEYYASEVDKYAIQITQKNFPNTIQLGDVKELKIKSIERDEDGIDLYNTELLIGGSPCQDLSIAKKNREGLKGSRSGLFYEYKRILEEAKPKYFILENVNSMPKEAKEEITKELFGIEPIMINAALVSAQNRKRLFWIGKFWSKDGAYGYEKVEIPQPEDRGVLLRDILEDNPAIAPVKSNTIRTSGRGSGLGDKHNWDTIRIGQIGKGGQGDRIYSPDGKSVNLSANGEGRGAKTGLYAVALTETRTEKAKKIRSEHYKKTGKDWSPRFEKELQIRKDNKSNTITTGNTKESLILLNTIIRKLTPTECCRLQSLPDGYCDGVSNTQQYKALGNGFNCAVIEHILKTIFK